MKKLRDYFILDLNYSSLEFELPDDLGALEGFPAPQYEFMMLSLSRDKVEEVKNQLTNIKSTKSFIDLYNSPTPKVDKQSFINFLEERGETLKIQPISFGIFDDEPVLKYLITHKETQSSLRDELSLLENHFTTEITDHPKLRSKQFSELCPIITNIISDDLFSSLSIASDNSNLIDILKARHQQNEIFKEYQESKSKLVVKKSKKVNVSKKDVQSSQVLLSSVLKQNANSSSIEDSLSKLKVLRNRTGFNFALSDRKVSINMRLSGPTAKSLLDFINNFFEELSKPKDDFFAENLPRIHQAEFISKWSLTLLDFFYNRFMISDNRKGRYSEHQIIAVSMFFKLLNFWPEKFKSNRSLNSQRKWLEEILPPIARLKWTLSNPDDKNQIRENIDAY